MSECTKPLFNFSHIIHCVVSSRKRKRCNFIVLIRDCNFLFDFPLDPIDEEEVEFLFALSPCLLVLWFFLFWGFEFFKVEADRRRSLSKKTKENMVSETQVQNCLKSGYVFCVRLLCMSVQNRCSIFHTLYIVWSVPENAKDVILSYLYGTATSCSTSHLIR